MMLRPGNPASTQMQDVAEHLADVCVALYGVRPENVLPEVIKSVGVWLTGKSITVYDIQEAYKTAIIEKKPYVGISRDELLQPVREYWQKKCALIDEIERYEAEKSETEEYISQSEKYRENALKLFVECYNKKEWTGDQFQANSVRSRELFSSMDIRVGRVLWESAKRDYKADAVRCRNGFLKMIPSTLEQTFSQKWISYVCSRQLDIDLY